MDWLTDESTELGKVREGYEAYLRRNKLHSHKKEMKKFIKNLSYIEFQELIELWAKHCTRKIDIAISARSDTFLRSPEWRRIRYLVIKEQKTCELCGWGASAGKQLHVDHIKSRWLYPELAFDLSNLQVLCEDCNLGKGITDDCEPFQKKKRGGLILKKYTTANKAKLVG